MIESILHFLCVLEIRFLVSTFPLTKEIFMTQIRFELPQSVIQVSPVKVTAVTKSGPLYVYLYTHVRQHGKYRDHEMSTDSVCALSVVRRVEMVEMATSPITSHKF